MTKVCKPGTSLHYCVGLNCSLFYSAIRLEVGLRGIDFYPRDAMLARVIAIATCPSVRPSRAGIVSKRRKLAA